MEGNQISFPYFGQKIALLKWYHPPLCDTIIEPFAGSARYSCKYGLERDVWINDKWLVIYDIWKWIRSATKSDIHGLPMLKKRGESFENMKYLSEPERHLLGFATGVGRATPCSRVSSFAEKHEGTVRIKKDLLRLCGKISHWRITNLDYSEIDNKRATWFIDPPYLLFGNQYRYNEKSIDFEHLGKWCIERKGQKIVCEAGEAQWLPEPYKFIPLKTDIRRVRRVDSYFETVFYSSDVSTGFGLENKQ